jgi:predicted nucleic acid-binding protein
MMVLVDSSVWIDFLRQAQGKMAALEKAIHDGRAAICPVVWVELWSGVRSKAEELALQEMRELCVSLEVDAVTWKRAADLSRVALRHGLNCPLADVLVVACAKRHGAELLYRDQHIDQLLALAADPGAKDRTK